MLPSFVKGLASVQGPARWGDQAAGDYSSFEADGTLIFTGDATVWDDLRVNMNAAKLGGGGVPTWGAIGGSALYGWHFADGDEMLFILQMPHGYKLGTNLSAHLHWSPVTDVDPSDNVGFGLEFAAADINGDFPFAATTDTGTTDCATGVDAQWKHIYSVIDNAVPGFNGVSGMIQCRLYRAAASADNYAGEVVVHEFDFHYEIDTVGSRLEASK